MAILEAPDLSLAGITEANPVLQYVGCKCTKLVPLYIALQTAPELWPHSYATLFT